MSVLSIEVPEAEAMKILYPEPAELTSEELVTLAQEAVQQAVDKAVNEVVEEILTAFRKTWRSHNMMYATAVVRKHRR